MTEYPHVSIRPCPICGADSDQPRVLELAATPLGDSLCRTAEQGRAAPTYDLDVALCSNCAHLYLPLMVAPEASYGDYHFTTGASPGLMRLLAARAATVIGATGVSPGDLILDVGSNDGAWLSLFREKGFEVLGVEPSGGAADIAEANGIPTLRGYFSRDLVEEGRASEQRPKLITANFVAANIPDTRAFFAELAGLCGPDSAISILSGYHVDQLRVGMFDYVYHEHLSYFTVRDFVRLADENGLVITSVQRVPLKGGGLGVVLRPKATGVGHCPDVNAILQTERWIGLDQPSGFEDVRRAIGLAKERTHASLEAVRGSVSEVIGYGFSHSVTTLTYEFELGELLDGYVDDSPSRQGWFTPGTGLPIRDPRTLGDSCPAVVITAWQHDYRVREKLARLDFDGPIIQPLPIGCVRQVSQT